MGRKRERFQAGIQEATSTARVQQGQDDRSRREALLGQMEQRLGTQEQIAGYGTDSRVGEYTRRYSIEGGVESAIIGGHKKSQLRKAGFSRERFADVLSSANDLMDQAEAAARAGDFEKADRLREKASTVTNIGSTGTGMKGARGVDISGLFNLGAAAGDSAAEGALSGPLAQMVGAQVADARALMDPNSPESQRFRESLTGGALEAISAGEDISMRQLAQQRREGERTQRDLGLARGAGRHANAERAFSQAASERFGTSAANIRQSAAAQRAQVLGEASRTFEDFRRKWSQGTAAFAQDFLQNKAGIREQFQSAVDSMKSAGSQLALQHAQRHDALYRFETQRADQRAKEKRENITKIAKMGAAVVGTALTAGAGLGMFGALGAAGAAGGAAGVTASAGGLAKGATLLGGALSSATHY